MCRACSTYGEEVYTRFRWGNLREGHHLKEAGVDGRIILKRIFEKWDVGMVSRDLVEYRDRWRNFVNALMNLRVS